MGEEEGDGEETGLRCRPILHPLILIISDGTVTASTVTAQSTTSGIDEPLGEDVSVFLAVSVDQKEHEREAELGGPTHVSSLVRAEPRADLHIEDTVGDDLGVDGNLVDALGQGPDNRVGSPQTGGSVTILIGDREGPTQKS